MGQKLTLKHFAIEPLSISTTASWMHTTVFSELKME